MADYSNLLNSIKKISVEAVDASKPTVLAFGKVIGVTPLKINVEQKMTLTAAQLVLTRNVTNHTISMTVNHATEYKSGGSGDSSFESHNHAYTGKKQFLVHNGLVVGDEVVLVRMQGGQKYIVLDRVVTA